MDYKSLILWLVFEMLQVRLVLSYDGYNSCSKAFRHSRKLDLPCDLRTQSYCTIPGAVYPWHAVRRFVFENHGLMKRMYGEQRHLSVLRTEIDDNEVEYGWFSHGHGHNPVLNRYEHQTPTSPATSPASTTSTTASTVASTSLVNRTTSMPPSVATSEDITVQDASDPPTTSTTEETTLETEPYSSTQAGSTTVLPLAGTTFSNEDAPRDEPDTSTKGSSTASTTATTAQTTSAATTTTSTTTEMPTFLSKPQIFQDVPTFKRKGVNACPVTEEVVAPFWANNTRGEVLALLNMYPFEQYVHWERCSHENKQMYCRKGCRCEQQYRLHRLLAYDPHDDCRGIFSDWFRFPSCCVCKCYDLPESIRLTSRSPRTVDL
uniref:Spaetzle domain-containing protein n=1 Tax=Cacopsylla melanoneura TaxID=428564 RepID=A0A8D8VX06_9HEMI